MSMIIVIPPDQFLLEISEEDTEKSVGEKLVKKYFPNVSEYSFKFSDPDYCIEPGTAAYCELTPKIYKIDYSGNAINSDDRIFCFNSDKTKVNVYDLETLTFLYDLPVFNNPSGLLFYSKYLIVSYPDKFQIIKEREIIQSINCEEVLDQIKIVDDKIFVIIREEDLIIYNFQGEILQSRNYYGVYVQLYDKYIDIDACLHDYEFKKIKDLKVDNMNYLLFEGDLLSHKIVDIWEFKYLQFSIEKGAKAACMNSSNIFISGMNEDSIEVYDKELNFIKYFETEEWIVSLFATDKCLIVIQYETVSSILL